MSSELLDELMRRSGALSDEEKMHFANHLVEQAGRIRAGGRERAEDALDASRPDPERRREQQWLLHHGKEYAGQWVALNGDCLLSHGTDGRVVLSEARRAGVANPFVVHVEKPDQLPFSGW